MTASVRVEAERDEWVEPHLTILGALYIACGLLSLLAGVLVFITMPMASTTLADPTLQLMLAPLGLVISLFLLLMAVACLIGGFGLLGRRSWSRLMLLVVGSINLINMPFGTLVGIYTLVILSQKAALGRTA